MSTSKRQSKIMAKNKTKDLANKAKKILEQTEDEVRNVDTIETTFNFAGASPLILKQDLCWQLKLNIKTILDRSYHRYYVRMFLNEDPYLDRIKDVDREIRLVSEDQTLMTLILTSSILQYHS